jgi:hypothetical protein
MKVGFFRHIFGKYSVSNLMKFRPLEANFFYTDRPTGRQAGGQDMTKLLVIFLNSAKAL